MQDHEDPVPEHLHRNEDRDNAAANHLEEDAGATGVEVQRSDHAQKVATAR
jgi:hypothetical protein